MARKSAAPVDAADQTTLVNIADFQRTRDSVIVALATLQSSVQDLSRAYINHANTVLGPGAGGALDSNLTNILSGSGLLGGARPATDLPAAVEEAVPEGKKKRKRAKHDPNAPKRALTPYFLFMQTARGEIARELGEQAKPKEVADEGTRRWSTMPAEDKHVWEESYQRNLAAYRVRMAAYKAGQPVPDVDAALRLVDEGKAPSQAQLNALGVEAEDDAEEVEEEETSPEPVKEPTPPKSNKRRKVEKAATPPKEAPKTAVKSPEKKGKKGKKEATPPPAPAAPAKSTEKKTKKSKKAA